MRRGLGGWPTFVPSYVTEDAPPIACRERSRRAVLEGWAAMQPVVKTRMNRRITSVCRGASGNCPIADATAPAAERVAMPPHESRALVRSD